MGLDCMECEGGGLDEWIGVSRVVEDNGIVLMF